MRAIGAFPPMSSRSSSTARADSWYLKYPAQSVSAFHESCDTRPPSGRIVPVTAMEAASYRTRSSRHSPPGTRASASRACPSLSHAGTRSHRGEHASSVRRWVSS